MLFFEVDDSQKKLIFAQLSVRHFMWFIYTLSYFAFFSCIGLTLLKDLRSTTNTDCRVYNFLPTISISIGYCFPQDHIWHFCFALNSFPRYIIGYLQMEHRMSRSYMALPKLYVLAQRTNGFVHFLELTCLLLLTYISLRENEWMHVYSYIGFIIFSLLHMLFTIGIDYMWPRTIDAKLTELEKKLRAKRLRWFLINLSSFFISLYFYLRHNSFCEPIVYSIHSLFEYFVVLTNIAYHGVVIEEWDQQEQIQISY